MTDAARAPEEDWAAELTAPDGQPLLAVVFGGAVLVLASILIPVPVIDDRLAEQGLILAASILGALLVWGVAYPITLRHCSTGWKVGTLVLLWVVALLAAERSLVGTRQALATDLSTIDEIEDGPRGRLAVQPGAERRGPVTRMLLSYLRESEADATRTEAAFVQTKLHHLARPDQLVLDGEVFDHCDRAGPAKALIADYDRRRQARADALGAAIDRLWVPETAKFNIRSFVERRSGISQLKPATAVDAEMIDALGERCTILARRGWKPWSYYGFAFTSPDDLKAFNANGARLDALVRKPGAEHSMVVKMFRLR